MHPKPSPASGPSETDPVQARIVQFAQERFFTCGFHSIPMDEIAAELGMSKKTIYQYFPSKKDLVEAALSAQIVKIRSGMDRIMKDEKLDFPARLGALLSYMVDRLSEIKPPFFHDLKRHAPDAFKRVEAVRRQTIPAYFGQLLNEGIRRKMVRPDLDCKMVIEIMLATIQTIVTPETLTRLGIPASQAFETILSTLFEGVMTPQGRTEYAAQRKK